MSPTNRGKKNILGMKLIGKLKLCVFHYCVMYHLPHLRTTDPCLIQGTTRYTSTSNCGGYWECTPSGHSHGRCCPPGYAYDVIKGCVPDATCRDSCNIGVTNSKFISTG